MKHPFQPFASALRKLGFRKQWAQRRTMGSPAVTQYEKPVAGSKRVVRVQLWGDGDHRASHSLDGREITTPTDFKTVPQMLDAILIEATRLHQRASHIEGNKS